MTRFEVRPAPGREDARGSALQRQARALGVTLTRAGVARVYLIESAMDDGRLSAAAGRLLADPVTEAVTRGTAPGDGATIVEVHPLPGVMDPVAQTVRDAIGDLVEDPGEVRVSTGWRYDLAGVGPDEARDLARRVLANPVIHRIHAGPFVPDRLPRGSEYRFELRHAALRELDDERLAELSRDAHLFLSLDEMRAARDEFRRLGREPTDIELETIAQTWSEHCVHKTLKSRVVYRASAPGGSEPAAQRDIKAGRASETGGDPRPRTGMEVSFTFTPGGRAADSTPGAAAATGTPADPRTSPPRTPPQHAADAIQWSARPGHTVNADGSVTIDNLLRSTVAAATHELIADGVDWTLSVFKDNSGVVALDDDTAVCIKVETHNHPSAIEPYGGAATGIGGCIRDVIGTGLGAKPIASTDVFCVAFPRDWRDPGDAGSKRPGIEDARSVLPPGCLHPRRVLTEVVAGVRDYGNRMGIPTVSGGVAFDDRYLGNPLVFAGCVGVMPREFVTGGARAGDRIVALGGRTGRDGIHGATFSSAELTDTHADEFSHAVQIGNAIEEKRLLDAILRARDAAGGPLFTAITDCGAGGFSSAIGEMGRELGAEVHLDRAPLKYAGLSYTEVWISEAQERMVLAVPPPHLAALARICEEEQVELADLGTFGTPARELVLRYNGTEVGRLDMRFLHEGLPQPVREASWAPARGGGDDDSAPRTPTPPAVAESLLALLAHPDIASRHWIIRQYDHEVQGNTVLKPLTGPGGRGPGDAAVIEPVPGSGRGIAIASGLQTPVGDPALGGDPYHMALAAIDECVRNLVCVGADPRRIAILDNFCWPSCARPENLGALVRAAEGCYDGAKAYRTPFVSGKDSLNNQLKYADPASGEERIIEIPPTLLITGVGIVPSVARCVTMDAKHPGNVLLLVGETTDELGASRWAQRLGARDLPIPRVDLSTGPRAAQAVAEIIAQGLAASAHDCSEGGLLVAVVEMLIATTAPAPGSATGSLDELLTRIKAPAPLGAELSIEPSTTTADELAFAETPSRYVLEVRPEDLARVRTILRDHGGVRAETIGRLTDTSRLVWRRADVDLKVTDLASAWLAPLDW